MTGKGLALTERDRVILSEVNRFGAVTRRQLIALRLFRSKTRANERLKKLTDAKLLTARPQALPQLGRQLVYLPGPGLSEPTNRRRRLAEGSTLFLDHQVGLVDIRIAFERHTTVVIWRSDRECEALVKGIRPDSFVEYRLSEVTHCAFIEYDRGTETLGRVERKVRAYADLAFSGLFTRTFGRKFFRLLLVIDTPGRLENLSRTTRRVTDRIVRLTTLAELVSQGPLASIWRRPGSPVSEPLTS